MWRQALAPQFRVLEADEHAALVELARGCSLAELAELAEGGRGDDETSEASATGAATLGEWLARWIAEGLVALPDALADDAASPVR